MSRGRELADRISSRRIRFFPSLPRFFGRLAPVAVALGSLWLPAVLSAQEAVPPLPPPVTRGLYRSRWFEFLNAHLEDDGRAAAAALADMRKTARAVGIHRLSDFSRTAVYEGRKAEELGRIERARRAYTAAVELDDTSVDALLSQIGFLLRQHSYAASLERLPWVGVALIGTHESRLALLSSIAIWTTTGFAAAVVAFVLVLILRHLPRIAHNLGELGGHWIGPRGAAPLIVLLLALPFAFGLGPLGAALCWSILLFPYSSRAERWVLGSALVLLGFVPPLLGVVARENIIERSPLFVAAVDLEEQREDGSAEDGLRQASAVFSEDPDVWFLLGMYAERSGDSERALASYDQAIAADSRDYRPFLNRGNVHFQEGDFAQAIRDYFAAAERNPRAAEAYYNLSIARGEAYDFDGQAAAMSRAREISESRVRGWIEHPTLARVVSAPYPLSRARQKVEQWNAQSKSRRLPGHAPPIRFPDAFLTPFVLAPWVAIALALVFAALLRSRGGLAAECTRCGKPFCPRCKRLGDPVLYCSDCVRLYLRKESAGIEAHVAQTREVHSRTRQRDVSCRLVSLVLPGAHLDLSDRPVASFLTLLLFLLLIAVAVIDMRLYDVRSLPPAHAWPVGTLASLVPAGILWLWSQKVAWKESHGP